MYRSLRSRDIFSELNRLQRFASLAFDVSPGIYPGTYGVATQRFPAINLSTSPQAVEVSCFAPGIDPDKLEVKLENGVLTIAGERNDQIAAENADKSNVRVNERFAGRFNRVVSLPDDVDGDAVTAQYRDGVLLIKVPRREAAQPRRITIQ